MKTLKTLIPVLAIAGLGGCAVYPSQGYDNTYYGSPVVGSPYVVEQPVYIGGQGYRSYPSGPNYGGYYNGYPRPYYPPRGYNNDPRGYDGGDRPGRPGPPRGGPDPRPPPPNAGPGPGPRPPQNAGPRPPPQQNIQPQPRPGVRQDSDGDGEPDRPMRR